MRTLHAWIILLCLFCKQSTAADDNIQRVGVPAVQHYTKAAYKAGNQNWAVAFGSNGIMYAANTDGLMAYDGQYWQLHTMPNRIVVRSLAVDRNDRIYTGGFAEFGYWEDTGFGRLQYHSLSNLLDEKYAVKDEIWKIHIDGDRILFQSFSTIYIYQQGRVWPLRAGGSLLFLHQVNNRLFVELLSGGLRELKGDRFVPVDEQQVLKGANILTMLPFKEEQILIGTSKNGLFLMDNGGNITPWTTGADDRLKRAQLNNGLALAGGYYAFGTILDGIYILDGAGRLIQHIHKGNGLQNNTVLSLKTDGEQNIWAGLDNGIDRIDIRSPLYYYSDETGSIGTVYAAVIFNGNIYLGTNQGLFYSPWTEGGGFRFRLIEYSQGQVWDLTIRDGELLCGHNDGTFLVQDDHMVRIAPYTGGWCFRPLNDGSSRMLQGTYNGLAILEKTRTGWHSYKLTGFTEPSQYVEQDRNNRVWTSSYTGLRQLTVNSDLSGVAQVRAYGTADGLPESPYINVFRLHGSLIFATDSGFHLYDEIADHFHSYQQLNNRLGSFAASNKVIDAGKNEYWFIRRGRVALVSFGAGGQVTVDSMRFAGLRDRMMPYYESVSRVENDLYLISMDDGFAVFRNTDATQETGKLPGPLIRGAEDITDSTAYPLFPAAAGMEIPYRRNNIRLSYALPRYSSGRIMYRFFLDGYSRSWSAWSEAAQKDFTNLNQGDYRFRVQAMTADGRLSAITTLEFAILPPWYLTWQAIVIYILLHIVLFAAVYRFYQYKIARHRQLVQEKLQREHEEQLRQEALQNEQRLVKLKNEQLEKELSGKNRELANSAMNIVYKNELLSNLHDELLGLKDTQGKRLPGDQLKKVNKIIEEARNDERDWNLFEHSFNEAHENFFKKLKSQYPDLVPNDLKMCAYLRLNMSSKEIAALLNITTRGVEIRRYRLRKKLNLPHDKNLAEFLIEL